MTSESMPPTDLRDQKPNMSGISPEKAPGSRQSSLRAFASGVWETLRYAAIAAIIIIPIRIYVAQPFVVSGNSMYPTFHNGEYLIVDELSKYVGTYARGDVVILRYPNDPSKYFIKRVIGLPGETVTIRGGVVTITSPLLIQALTLDEPYVKNAKIENLSRTLDTEEYFVMGDNRAQSSDSRVWGPVPTRLMDGKALVRLFPFTRISYKPGNAESFQVTYANIPSDSP